MPVQVCVRVMIQLPSFYLKPVIAKESGVIAGGRKKFSRDRCSKVKLKKPFCPGARFCSWSDLHFICALMLHF